MIDAIKANCFILLFVFANFKYFDLVYGMANLDFPSALAVFIITYALIITMWLPFPRSLYAY